MSDPETGIGSWSEAEIKRALTEGVRPSGVPLAPQMPVAFYKTLTPRDLERSPPTSRPRRRSATRSRRRSTRLL